MTATKALEQGEGILRLAPTWVPRSFCIPGRRLKLHPSDLYAFGAHRGGIDERWFASTTQADNGPETTPDEGLSYVVWGDAGPAAKDPAWPTWWPSSAQICWAMRCGTRTTPGPCTPSSSTTRARCPITCTRWRSTPAASGSGTKPEGYFFPRQTEQLRRRLPVHLLRAGGRRTKGAGAPLSGDLGRGRQPHHRPVEGLPARTRHGLVGARRHSPRAGQPVHL